MIDTASPPAPAGHHVHFFETDETLTAVVAAHLSGALLGGDAAVIVATPARCALFSAALAEAGVDVDAATRDGRLFLRDAAGTLARFTVEGGIDAERFDAVLGGLIRDAAAGGRRAEIYGEMVALLWDAGDVTGALELEGLWNTLSESLAFGLLCAYPADLFADAVGAERFAEVCHHHARVVAGAPSPPDVEVSRRFPTAPQTPRLARRFVGETLHGWGCTELADSAMLVVTELVTNAVLHAGSDVSVGIARAPGRVRIVIGDASEIRPERRMTDPLALSGRGMRMVDDMADAWGCDVVEGGKLIWVDLSHAGVR